jgi:hypothetical protein
VDGQLRRPVERLAYETPKRSRQRSNLSAAWPTFSYIHGKKIRISPAAAFSTFFASLNRPSPTESRTVSAYDSVKPHTSLANLQEKFQNPSPFFHFQSLFYIGEQSLPVVESRPGKEALDI